MKSLLKILRSVRLVNNSYALSLKNIIKLYNELRISLIKKLKDIFYKMLGNLLIFLI